jgi:hypothetical protein
VRKAHHHSEDRVVTILFSNTWMSSPPRHATKTYKMTKTENGNPSTDEMSRSTAPPRPNHMGIFFVFPLLTQPVRTNKRKLCPSIYIDYLEHQINITETIMKHGFIHTLTKESVRNILEWILFSLQSGIAI